MIEMNLLQAARVSGAQLHGAAVDFRGLALDSRQVEPGQLFLGLAGRHTHGAEHAAQAAGRGAAGMLSDRRTELDWPQLQHPRPEQALSRLAAHWRQALSVRVVGVTGSNGKTTVKNLLAALLAADGATYATRGNFNNELGLPLSLCQLGAEHRWAVLEMGAAKPGDIAELAEMALPEVAVITNASAAHLQGMGSLEWVVRTKGEMLDFLPAHGVAVLNRDDPAFEQWRERAGQRRLVSFGSEDGADVRVLPVDEPGRLRLRILGQETELPFQLLGAHNRLNAAAAVAACVGLELDLPSVLPALASVQPEPGRLNPQRRRDGLLVLDDSYNANPASCMRAIDVLMAQPAQGQRWLVLGDMAELGEASDGLHERVGRYAQSRGVNGLWAVGRHAPATRAGFGTGPGTACANKDELMQALMTSVRPGDVVLVKGSRSMGMDSVVRDLLEDGAC